MVKNFCSSGNPLRDRKSLDSSIISRIEFADFLPGEATTNRRAELDEIYAAHEGCLDSVGIDRPLDFLVNPLDAVDEVTGLRLGFVNTTLSCSPSEARVPNTGPGANFA